MNTIIKLTLGAAALGCLSLGALRADEPDKKPARDPTPVAAAIDRELDRKLAEAKVTPAPAADDAEFLRRAYLDLTGRIPTVEQAVAFLDSKAPDKRRKLIDQLLESENYGKHFGIIWSDLIVKRDENNRLLRPDAFKAWLAEGFNKNRGWNEIVTDLLTAEGSSPPALFFLANRDMTRVAPNKIIATTANLFLGVQMQCAECHNHPFVADWKQKDFWAMAAFFVKVRANGGAGNQPTQQGVSITESAATGGGRLQRNAGPAQPGGPVINIPDAVDPRKVVGTARAKFFEGDEPMLDDKESYRKAFAAWLTSPENKYFAPAMANRLWAHFYARGIVNPIEDFSKDNKPSHPELLQLLSKEFADSGFDLKHLIRCICNTRAYQRTSQPVSNDVEPQLFASMTVKVMSAEVLYDSLCLAMGESSIGDSGGARPAFGAQRGAPQGPRERFVNFFTTREEGDEATEFGLGVPQFLRLMNSAQFNKGGKIIDELCKDNASREKVIEGLFLATLSRRPTEAELKRLSDYAAKKSDARAGYNGVLWVLLNSAEFICIR